MGSGILLTGFLLVMVVAWMASGEAEVYSAKLIHRFSVEMRSIRVSRSRREVNAYGNDDDIWPRKGSSTYYGKLLSSDMRRQTLKMGPQFQYLFPSEGSTTLPLGNDFGWLHYTWIDIGTPNVSFLVALDTGSDLLWVPCNCLQCAPLSASYYSNLDKDLNEYNPSGSTTKKDVSCSHQLCKLGSNCQNQKEPCPYIVNYDTDDTSTSGLLVQDMLHLASGTADRSHKIVRAPVIIGCGSKQSGGYLTGVAPDGLMGLGRGEISVPSFLAREGLTRNCFSLCFNEDDSGRIFFGDQGIAKQHTTPFLSSDIGNVTYLVGVEACCIASSCLEQSDFKALVDSGTSFTYLPDYVYQKVVKEFNRQVNSTKSSFKGYPWQYCYKSSPQELPEAPSLSLKFALNNSFEVINPIFIIYDSQGAVGFCLAIQPTDGNIGTIGQNFMTGYRMVFDREKKKLGWSRSNCEDLTNGKRMPMAPLNGSSPNPLPTTVQQSTPNGHAVAPAIAGRTASKSTALVTQHFHIPEMLLLVLLLVHMVLPMC